MQPFDMWKDVREDIQRECDEIFAKVKADKKKETIQTFKEAIKE
jgi:hypothetical protein